MLDELQVESEDYKLQEVCARLGYRINSNREGSRWLKTVNGEVKDFYQLVPQEG